MALVHQANQANQWYKENQRYHQSFGVPAYVKSPGFEEFLKLNEASHNEGTGYMFIRLDKENSFYRSGETVKGTVFFELFH